MKRFLSNVTHPLKYILWYEVLEVYLYKELLVLIQKEARNICLYN